MLVESRDSAERFNMRSRSLALVNLMLMIKRCEPGIIYIS